MGSNSRIPDKSSSDSPTLTFPTSPSQGFAPLASGVMTVTVSESSSELFTLSDTSSIFTSHGSVTALPVTGGAHATAVTTATPNPLDASQSVASKRGSSFLANKAAVGCTIAFVTLFVLSAVVGLCMLLRRRQRQRRQAKGTSFVDFFMKGNRLSGTTMATSLEGVYARQGKEFDLYHE
ncbi:hypothetical protein SCHPADRAFT_898642 [Schizopora paradoxa]|uniref:Mid2 domain-containing protein n=1 Tax=Schizopora paradoxa TaxID=27342 RepID=A0A0H2S6V0_9AGAM|nr:hypothetical protein SCHPADRAFT_898642 [Schizopora paradoxa]